MAAQHSTESDSAHHRRRTIDSPAGCNDSANPSRSRNSAVTYSFGVPTVHRVGSETCASSIHPFLCGLLRQPVSVAQLKKRMFRSKTLVFEQPAFAKFLPLK